MRFALVLIALALAACAPHAEIAGCDLSIEREVAFTAPDARDVVTARTLGPSCDRAIGHYAVTSADGHPLWAWTAPMPRAFGDIFQTADAEAMRTFLERWSTPRIETTAAAPAWPLADWAHTTLDRVTYEDIRARDLPMLCHLSGTGVETCVFWEPAAASAGHFLERDVSAQIEGNPT
jgi:hypothetical protein